MSIGANRSIFFASRLLSTEAGIKTTYYLRSRSATRIAKTTVTVENREAVTISADYRFER
jgi:hypothetical protein